MTAQTAAILPAEWESYRALGWEHQYDLAYGRMRILWRGNGPAPHPEQGEPTCGDGCQNCVTREANAITAAYLRLDPSAWPALEAEVRARLEAART